MPFSIHFFVYSTLSPLSCILSTSVSNAPNAVLDGAFLCNLNLFIQLRCQQFVSSQFSARYECATENHNSENPSQPLSIDLSLL